MKLRLIRFFVSKSRYLKIHVIMKAAGIREIKAELKERSPQELLEICLKLTRFKKENKELLTYLLFEEEDEDSFIIGVKEEMDTAFAAINKRSYYLMKKGVRKILKETKKYIRYSKKKPTEVELILHFCKKTKLLDPSGRNVFIQNICERNLIAVKKKIATLHEDLQFDYEDAVAELEE